MVAKAYISNSILGWMLIPANEESTLVVAKMYGHDTVEQYLAEKRSERGTMKDEPLEKFLSHVLEVAKDMGIGVSVCGNRKTRPVLRLWMPNPPTPVPFEEHSVDLKWSLWTIDRSEWESYHAANIYDRMEKAFLGAGPVVVVKTAPRKEIRCGEVIISKGKADGWFATEWDEPETLADTLHLIDDKGDWPAEGWPETMSQEEINRSSLRGFCESLPASLHLWTIGLDWNFTVRARSFPRLMEKIDKVENQLLQADQEEWASVQAVYITDTDGDEHKERMP